MIKLGKIFGIETHVHLSTLILAALIYLSGMGIAEKICPQCPSAITIFVSLMLAVLFIFSIFLHEVAHCKVGALFGVGFENITIFVLGGAAKMKVPPPTAKAEFFMALAGPLASFAIGIFFYIICYYIMPLPKLSDPNNIYIYIFDIVELVAFVNVMLGLFNILPIFPLDGGRILRAILWKIFNKSVATIIAGFIGIVAGVVFVVAGGCMLFGYTIPVLGDGIFNGLLIGFVGYFIFKLAVNEIRAQANEKENFIQR